jgi:hypothetical protein
VREDGQRVSLRAEEGWRRERLEFKSADSAKERGIWSVSERRKSDAEAIMLKGQGRLSVHLGAKND